MTWDRLEYRERVLEPARKAGNILPADLRERYGFHLVGPHAEFGAHIDAVTGYWKTLEQDRRYGTLARKLMADHKKFLDEGGQLTSRRFADLGEQARRRAQSDLERLARAEAQIATHAGPGTVARMIAMLAEQGRHVSEAGVRKALAGAGVAVVEKITPLPEAAHPKYPDLAAYVQELDCRLSAEIVFGKAVARGFRVLGGFRLEDGTRLDDAALAIAQGEADKRPYSDADTASVQRALAVMREMARAPGALDSVVLWEIVSKLRKLADLRLPQRTIALGATELGLAEDEAGILAVCVLDQGALDTRGSQINDALAAGRLRTAQELASTLPDTDDARRRVAAAAARVDAIVARADAALAVGRTEDCASLLAEATVLASDDEGLAGRLRDLPPPAPPAATAVVSGHAVIVRWEPSPARAGRLRYLVRRGEGRAPASPGNGDAVEAPPDGQQAIDTEAPPGSVLRYAVFASRGGATWSSRPRPARQSSRPRSRIWLCRWARPRLTPPGTCIRRRPVSALSVRWTVNPPDLTTATSCRPR